MKRQAGKQFYKLAVVAWLAFSIGSVVLALVAWSELSARMAVSGHVVLTRDELNSITATLLTLRDAQRGYVITGDKKFVSEFNTTATNLPATFDRLVDLVHDNQQMLPLVTQLRADVELGVEAQRDVMAARDKNFDKAAAVIATGEAQNTMDKALAEAAQLNQLGSEG